MTETAEYEAYTAAKQRCVNPRRKEFPNYGGRGIEFRFTCFEQFFAELGPRPEGMSLDRINNDGHYEPGNVRWTTKKQQQQNRRFYGRLAQTTYFCGKLVAAVWTLGNGGLE